MTDEPNERAVTDVVGNVFIARADLREDGNGVRIGRSRRVAVGAARYVELSDRENGVVPARRIALGRARIALKNGDDLFEERVLRRAGKTDRVAFEFRHVLMDFAPVVANGPTREIVFREEIFDLSGIVTADRRRFLTGEPVVYASFLILLRGKEADAQEETQSGQNGRGRTASAAQSGRRFK